MPQRPRRSQDERSDETRTALHRATIRLLLDRGYSRFTTADAAAAAGVSRGALTHHFASKEDLVVRSVAQDLAGVTEGLRVFLAEGRGRRRGPDELVDHLWALMAGGLFYVTMEYLPEARHNAPFRERLLPVVRDFHAALDALWCSVSDAHDLDPAEAQVTLNATLCLMRGMVAQSVLKPDESYFAAMLDHWKAHLRALFARSAGARDIPGPSHAGRHHSPPVPNPEVP